MGTIALISPRLSGRTLDSESGKLGSNPRADPSYGNKEDDMSKVPYTINVDSYICTELESIRKMLETHDFSTLKAAVERIQFHATAMEEALYRYEGIKYKLKNKVDDKDVNDAAFRETALKVLKELDK